MKRLAVCLLPVLLVLTYSSHAARIFKWSDAQGTHYSDRPPSPMAVERESVETRDSRELSEQNLSKGSQALPKSSDGQGATLGDRNADQARSGDDSVQGTA